MKKILIIDDDLNVRMSMRKFLEDCQYVVFDTESGKEGLEIFKKQNPDLILVDLRTREIDGLEILTRVTEESPNTPVIVVSATGVLSDAIEALRRGAWDYLLKPIEDMSMLKLSLERALDRVNLIRDRHAAIELRKKAEASEKAKSAFLANMSHEIRTPMNAILGFCELLKGTPLDKYQRDYLNAIDSGGKMLMNIINEILDFSKICSGKITLETIDFDLQYLINDVFKLMISRFKDKNIDAYIDFDKNIPFCVKGDPTRLRQILTNLLGNAVKFTKEGEIGIIVKLENEVSENNEIDLRFCVKDTGIGISKDKYETIFDSFSQADVSTTRQYGGTGLGLSICKSIVELMDGRMWVESEEGKGSSFFFTIKLKKGDFSKRKEIFPLDRVNLKGKRVIIVDDNEVSRRILKKCCEEIEMEIVSIYESANIAFEDVIMFSKSNKLPDLILCDILMPQMDGYELVRRIRENIGDHEIKIIAIASDVQVGTAYVLSEKGFDGFLPKPVSVNELIKVISTVLGDKREEGPIVTRHMAEELQCKGLKILVVEDSIEHQGLIREYFRLFGCSGDFAKNGKEALKNLQINKYDLCIMDLQMPLMGGLETAQIIRREISEELPIIALSASPNKSMEEKVLTSGFNDFLRKPVEMMVLKEAIFKHGRKLVLNE